MTDETEISKLRLLPGEIRHDFRKKQIEAIKKTIHEHFADRIRAAETRKEKKAIKAERDAEVARQTEPLLQEAKDDGPHCL